MKTILNLKNLVALSVISLAGLVGASQAQAGHDGYGYEPDYCPPCRYEWKIFYVCKQVPYTKCITLYDHCGHPYTVEKVFYKTIEVPVKKLVKVCD